MVQEDSSKGFNLARCIGGYNQNANTKRRAILSLGSYLASFGYIVSFQNVQWYIIFLQLIDDKEPA